jgi:cell division topological specificity factor
MSKLFGFDLSEDDARRTSKQAARERLKLALTYDRASIGYNALERLRDEIIEVIAKHLDLDQEDITIQLDRTMDQDKLIASIPLRINTRSHGSSSPTPMKATPPPSWRRRR